MLPHIPGMMQNAQYRDAVTIGQIEQDIGR
jgi:hypothetical protein